MSRSPGWETLQAFHSRGFADGYVAHPDPLIDLACINISSFGEPALGLYFRHYSDQQLLEEASQLLSLGQDVFFIGYPENRFDVTHNLPLLRKGCIASAPNVDFNGKRQFLIDAQVFQGSSGSPVFALTGGEFKIAGVISQTMIETTGLLCRPFPLPAPLRSSRLLGSGSFFKAVLLRELLNHAAQHFSTRAI